MRNSIRSGLTALAIGASVGCTTTPSEPSPSYHDIHGFPNQQSTQQVAQLTPVPEKPSYTSNTTRAKRDSFGSNDFNGGLSFFDFEETSFGRQITINYMPGERTETLDGRIVSPNERAPFALLPLYDKERTRILVNRGEESLTAYGNDNIVLGFIKDSRLTAIRIENPYHFEVNLERQEAKPNFKATIMGLPEHKTEFGFGELLGSDGERHLALVEKPNFDLAGGRVNLIPGGKGNEKGDIYVGVPLRIVGNNIPLNSPERKTFAEPVYREGINMDMEMSPNGQVYYVPNDDALRSSMKELNQPVPKTLGPPHPN